MAFKFRTRRPATFVDPPGFPRIATSSEEPMTGMVGDMQASAGEENLAGGLDYSRLQYRFRHVIGAPKGLPGWKEVDFIVFTRGLIYAVEVDTAFTHRDKQYKDVLHDATILNDRELNSYGTLYPQVIHVDGETELATRAMAKSWVARVLGKG